MIFQGVEFFAASTSLKANKSKFAFCSIGMDQSEVNRIC